MDYTELTEITPLAELPEEDKQKLQTLDLDLIERTVRQTGSCVIGKRRALMPTQSEANLRGRPEEEIRRDAAFVLALHNLLADRHLVFRSLPGPDGERLFVAYLEGGPDDDLACSHYIEEWSLYQRFRQEHSSRLNWEQVCAQVSAHGRVRWGRRSELLPIDTDLFIDEQALLGERIQGGLTVDLVWLATLGEVADEHGVRVAMEHDPETGEIWLEIRSPEYDAAKMRRRLGDL